MPSLKEVSLGIQFRGHQCFFETLARKGKESKVETVMVDGLLYPTPASSRLLAEALCYMPNLTELTLGRNLTGEFYSTLKAKASSIQVQTLKLDGLRCSAPASSHHLPEALCSMPNLTNLTLGGGIYEEFYSALKAKASSIQVQTVTLDGSQCPTPASSHLLAEALCYMPNLTDLTFGGCIYEEFYSALKAKASSIQVQTFKFEDLWFPTPAASHNIAEALCSMPNLTDLTLGMFVTEEFYSTLKAKASSMQDCFPQIEKGNFRFEGVAQDDLNSFLHILACLQRLHPQRLRESYLGNTYNTRNVSSVQSRAMYPGTMASTSRVNPVHANTSVSLDTLPRGLGAHIPVLQESLDNALVRLQQPGTLRNQSGIRQVYLDNNAPPWNIGRSQPQFMPYNLQSGMSAGYLSPSQYPPPVPENTGATHSTNFSSQIQSTSSTGRDHPQQQPMGNEHYPRRTLPPSDHPQPQPMGDVHYPRRTLPPSDYPQRQPLGGVHYPRRTLPPSNYPQQQPMSDINYLRRSLPLLDHTQQQPRGDVNYLRKTLPSSDHPQQQPMGDVHYPRRTLPPSDHPQQQPMGDVHHPRRALPLSDHPQQQPMGDVYPRTSPSSDYPQQHVGNTSDTVFQLSQTHREGSSSLSRPYKRQATCTQSRVPQDDPEISEKRSKYEV